MNSYCTDSLSVAAATERASREQDLQRAAAVVKRLAAMMRAPSWLHIGAALRCRYLVR